MRPKVALALAIVFALAATALVTYETVYGLRATLATTVGEDSDWQVVARYRDGHPGEPVQYGPREGGDGCAGPHLLLTVENYAPVPDSVRLRVTYYDATTQTRVALLEGAWRLDAYETREEELRVPRSGYLLLGETQSADRPWHPSDVAVTLDGNQVLWACVRGSAG